MTDNPQIIWLENVDSTNRYAWSHFNDLPDGALVVALEQTAGRGRHGRSWQSPAGMNIYASLVMKQLNGGPARASMVASLGVIDAFRAVAPEVDFWLKWPNDIFVSDRKIAGILCESKSAGNNIPGIVAGMGININMPTKLLDKIDQPAASLLSETGQAFSLARTVQQLATALKKRYAALLAAPHELYAAWKKENRLIGQTVEILRDNETIKGRIADVGPNGELNFETDGTILKLHSGDIQINKSSIAWSQ